MTVKHMGKILKDLTFDDWVLHMFNHPVTETAWHWDLDADEVELEPQQVIAYTTRLFTNARELLTPYTDAQVNQGLWFLIGEGHTPLTVLTDANNPLDERSRCIHAITQVFEQSFLPRCTPHLSHVDEPGASPLNLVCYMWWDIFPLRGQPKDASRQEIDAACLSVMETTLQLPSIACQESALHGLGHWGRYYEGRCQSIISTFMQRHRDLRPQLRTYAESAQKGCVL
jgi:hypothetical protein